MSTDMISFDHDLSTRQKALIEEWVDALRSGEYDQHQHALRDENSFCCLGVLCDLQDDGEWEDWKYKLNREEYDFKLPRSIVRQYGLRTRQGNSPKAVPTVSTVTVNTVMGRLDDEDLTDTLDSIIEDQRNGYGIGVRLSALNDGGVSFELIADLIEEEYLN